MVDATNLDRHLYLALQVIELGRPIILALNMMDAADEQGLRIDVSALERRLGVPGDRHLGREGPRARQPAPA